MRKMIIYLHFFLLISLDVFSEEECEIQKKCSCACGYDFKENRIVYSTGYNNSPEENGGHTRIIDGVKVVVDRHGEKLQMLGSVDPGKLPTAAAGYANYQPYGENKFVQDQSSSEVKNIPATTMCINGPGQDKMDSPYKVTKFNEKFATSYNRGINYRKDNLYGVTFGITDSGARSKFGKPGVDHNYDKDRVDLCVPKSTYFYVDTRPNELGKRSGLNVQICSYVGRNAKNAIDSDKTRGCFCTFNPEDERCQNSEQGRPVEVLGCTDQTASNYNPEATSSDCSCKYEVYGCTDPTASNFNESATVNDGTCSFYGCTDPNASNFNPKAKDDDGSCVLDSEGSSSNNSSSNQGGVRLPATSTIQGPASPVNKDRINNSNSINKKEIEKLENNKKIIEIKKKLLRQLNTEKTELIKINKQINIGIKTRSRLHKKTLKLKKAGIRLKLIAKNLKIKDLKKRTAKVKSINQSINLLNRRINLLNTRVKQWNYRLIRLDKNKKIKLNSINYLSARITFYNRSLSF